MDKLTQAHWLNTVAVFAAAQLPCECIAPAGWQRYRVGNLDVRECRDCGATWTERHRADKDGRVIR